MSKISFSSNVERNALATFSRRIEPSRAEPNADAAPAGKSADRFGKIAKIVKSGKPNQAPTLRFYSNLP
jgi:hypothetical protein